MLQILGINYNDVIIDAGAPNVHPTSSTRYHRDGYQLFYHVERLRDAESRKRKIHEDQGM